MHSKRVFWSSVLCVLLGGCADVDGQPEDAEDVSEVSERIEQQNLAAGKPATQSSTLYPFSAARAVDSNTDGHFPNGSVTHTGFDPQAWWQVDLGAVTDIGKVVLYNRTDGDTGGRLANFDVLLSNDGTNWQMVASFPGIASASTELSIIGSGRFVRVRLRGTEVLSLAEVQVFAPASEQKAWTPCALEGATCSFSGAKAVRYGASGSYVTKIALNSIGCDNATFGDPSPFTPKSCSYIDVLWSTCAVENGTCAIPANSMVRYGANGTYTYQYASSSVACNNATFGDPSYGTVKHCDVASVSTSTCQIASNEYGIDHGLSWGFAPQDVQTWWLNNNCDTRPVLSNTCQIASNEYGIDHGMTWGFAPQDVRTWWINNNCNTRPPFSACQTASNEYGIDHGLSWGFAPQDVRTWWVNTNCNTRPASSNTCQTASNEYGIDHGLSWGFAPQDVRDWWVNTNCNTRPQ
ncbi:discoidin domain-containing protein [Sorangium sp. So ce118]